jgi:glycosyltransferase involved in cell wall biosynthesis
VRRAADNKRHFVSRITEAMQTSHDSAAVTVTPTAVPVLLPQSQECYSSNSSDNAQLETLRVMHVINGEHFSGAERVQQLLGKQLGGLGVDTWFACIKPNKFPELCGLDASRVLALPMRGRLDLKVVGQLVQCVKDRDIQLLHAHTPRTAMITSLVALRTGLPWCYHVHSPTARDSTRGAVNQLNGMIERWAIRSCTRLITVSRSLRREMLRLGVPRSRLSVVPNGVPAIEPIDALTRLDRSTWRLGLIALMRPRKGVEVALEAMQQLNNRGTQIHLELIGGFESESYQQQTIELMHKLQVEDVVSWTGFTKDIPGAIRRLDALVLPSLFGEGMPMVVLEALAAAVPVVATRVEGTPEVIRDGVEGLLAKPRCAESLSECLNRLTGDRERWSAMSQAALRRHRQAYSDQLMAERVAKIYRDILH